MTMATINRITDSWLRTTDELIPPRIEAPVDRAYKLGLAILTHVFGVNWRDANIFHAREGFLKNVTDANTPLEREVHKMRIVLLAEMILNLQDVPGFDACVGQMLNRDLIESTCAELEIARLLYTQSTVSFEFRRPVGVKKDDYDLTVTYDDGVVCCAETKCKAEETEITLDTIEHSFKKARGQMPSDVPSIIFVKVPRFWLDDEDFAFAMARLANDYFDKADKIVSIKYYTASILLRQEAHGETTSEVIAYQEHSNPKHRFVDLREKDWRIFPEDPAVAPPERTSFNGMPPHWRRLFFYPDNRHSAAMFGLSPFALSLLGPPWRSAGANT
jgi:hypothetical protein